jgi:hypothetical protein
MAQATGRVKVKVNGTQLRSKRGASLQIGGVTRNDVPNDDGTVDFNEETQPAQITATLTHTSETDLIALRNFKGGTVVFETDTGVSYSVGGAYTKSVGELSEGEVPVTFGGQPAEQA